MEDVNKRRQIFLSLFLNSSAVPKKSIPRESPTFDIFSELQWIREGLKKREFILKVKFSLMLHDSRNRKL